jgi:carbon storage regulator
MLVLTRRTGEEIVIAGNIRVSVLSINGRNVRLGITAPREVHVVRLELLSPPTHSAAPPTMWDGKSAEPGQRNDGGGAQSRDL